MAKSANETRPGKPDDGQASEAAKADEAQAAPAARLYAVNQFCALNLSPGDVAERSAFRPKASKLTEDETEAQADANIARLIALGVIAEAE